MTQPLAIYSAILLISVFISSVSQVILKKAALKQYDSTLKSYLNFPVIFAYVLFFLTTVITIFAYKVVPLSFGPVLESTSYIYVTAFGALFFKERVTAKKVIALALIIAGIAVYALTI